MPSNGLKQSQTLDQRKHKNAEATEQRDGRMLKNTSQLGPRFNELKGGEPQFLVNFADYYKKPRGFHPRAINSHSSWTHHHSRYRS